MWQTLLSYLSPSMQSGDTKKSDDKHVESGGYQSPLPAVMMPRQTRRNIRFLCFAKQYSVALCLAATDEARKLTRFIDDTVQSDDATQALRRQAEKERMYDANDCVVPLSALVSDENLVVSNKSGEQGAWRAKFDNGYAVVVEVALLIDDVEWDPRTQYVRIHLTDIAPLQQSVSVLGDRNVVLARCIAPAQRNGAQALRHQCPMNQNKLVDGWCHQCGARPNTITLYQTPLDDNDLVKYVTEIISHNGTHGHVVKHTVSAPNVDDDDERQRYDDSLEINTVSTLAHDLCARNEANYQPGFDKAGAVFVALGAWRSEVASASARVLFNLPLANMQTASLRICARASDASQRTLRVKLVVQCLGLKE